MNRQPKAVLFDLDDTLFPEIAYVHSGFTAVSEHLGRLRGLEPARLQAQMIELLAEHGRGRIFNLLLEPLGPVSREDVLTLVYVYRTHAPDIRLYDDAKNVLDHLADVGITTGLVTNGMGSVQRAKIAALGLETILDVIVCTDDLGPGYAKPSSAPFQVALGFLGTTAEETFYVGNDPEVDFPGARELGLVTVHLDRGGSAAIPPGKAAFTVRSLHEVRSLVKGPGLVDAS